jgi:hypothetical protein
VIPPSGPANHAGPRAAGTFSHENGRTIAAGSSAKTDTARKLHFVLQGKGGIGKTMVALMLAQCIAERGERNICVDTDPVEVLVWCVCQINAAQPLLVPAKPGSTVRYVGIEVNDALSIAE